MLPRTRALDSVLVCCPQAGLPTFPVPLVPGTRGMGIGWVQIGGKIRRVEVALGRDATGTQVPALPEGLFDILAAARTELREFGTARGNARPAVPPVRGPGAFQPL